jgi:hypothetical protein
MPGIEERAVERITEGFLKTPNRLSPTYAKGMVALSLFVLVIAAFGLFIYDGVQRVAYVSAMGSIALGNLAWSVGSLMPEERGGRTVRDLARPCFLVMFIALPIALYLQVQVRSGS